MKEKKAVGNMTAENTYEMGIKFLENYRQMVADRFIGHEDAVRKFYEILEYTKRGKPMPLLAVVGPSGCGKSWLLTNFIEILTEKSLPVITVAMDDILSPALPEGFTVLATEIRERYGFDTPRFDKVREIYIRRFFGLEPPPPQESGGLIRDLLRTFKGAPEDTGVETAKLKKNYGEEWQQALISEPFHRYITAMALALAEDIDSYLEKKKTPFLSLIIDGWDGRTASHWKRLISESNRLFGVVANNRIDYLEDAVKITLADFDSSEARAALRRRGISSGHVVSNIIGQTGGNPLEIALAASLAELIARSGDIIREDSFRIPEGYNSIEEYSSEIWDKLRDSERHAIGMITRIRGIRLSTLMKIADQENFFEIIENLAGLLPFYPPITNNPAVKLHGKIELIFNKLSAELHLPTSLELAENEIFKQPSTESEIIRVRLMMSAEPEEAFTEAIEKAISRFLSGDYDFSERLYRAAKPSPKNKGLTAIYLVFGNRILEESLSPQKRLEYYNELKTSDSVEEGIRLLGHAAALEQTDDVEPALKELQECVSSLSAAITETSGGEPALWFIRAKALHLASEMILKTGVSKEALSTAQKAAESYSRAIDAGLDPAGSVSLECARARILGARAEMMMGENRAVMTLLDRAGDAVADASAKRDTLLPDISLIKAEIYMRRAETHQKFANYPEAEEFYTAALEELSEAGTGFLQFSAEKNLFSGELYLSLAELLYKTGSEESAFEIIGYAENAFNRYEAIVGGGDPSSWIGRGKLLLLRCDILSTRDTEKAIAEARDAGEYFLQAVESGRRGAALLGRIDSMIIIGNLLAESGGQYDKVFDRADKILTDSLSERGPGLPLIKRRIELAKGRGRAAYLEGDNDKATRHFAAAIEAYAELHSLSPETPFASELAEIHLASAVSFRDGGEPFKAFQSLIRAEEAFETAADRTTKEGQRKVLHNAIGVYNDLASIGCDEDAFEAALFALDLVSQVGGTEVMEIGQELLVYWEAQDLSPRDRRRLKQASAPLHEHWGEF